MEDLMDITEDSENEKNSRLDKPVKKGGIDWAAAAKDMTFVDEGDVAEVQGAVALRKPGKERFFQVHPNEADYSSALQVLESGNHGLLADCFHEQGDAFTLVFREPCRWIAI